MDVELARDRRPDEGHADHDRDEHEDARHAEDRGGAEPRDEDGNDERAGSLGAGVDGHHQPHGAAADGIRGHALQERGARHLEDEVAARDEVIAAMATTSSVARPRTAAPTAMTAAPSSIGRRRLRRRAKAPATTAPVTPPIPIAALR